MSSTSDLLPTSLITDVVTDLRATWKGIGLPETEQDAKLTDVAAQIAAQLRSAVQAEEDKKRGLEEELESMGGELDQLSATLGEPRPDATPEAPALLVQSHAAISTALDSLKTVKATRAAQRREAEANVACLHCELHDPVDGPPVCAADIVPGPGPAEAGGLSEAFLGKLRAKVDELRSERAARIDQAAFLSSDIGRIQKELGDDEEESDAAPRRTTLEQLGGNNGGGGGGTNYQVSPSALEALETKLRGLQAEQQRRRRVLEECLEYITELRAKLHVGEADCPPLPKPERGLTKEVMAAYQVEIDRLEALKAAALPRILQASRGEARGLIDVQTRPFFPPLLVLSLAMHPCPTLPCPALPASARLFLSFAHTVATPSLHRTRATRCALCGRSST